MTAIVAAHDRNVIHRHLKPANILLDRDRDQLLVCDFGVANVLAHRVLNPAGRTLRDLFTRPYASPEQRMQGEALYPADVYALSIVITALLDMTKPTDGFRVADFGDLWAPAQLALESAALSPELSTELHQCNRPNSPP